MTLTYSASGNILSKSDVGAYVYGQNGAGPHAVTTITGVRANTYHYDANGNIDCLGDTTSTCSNGDPVTWYSFNKPKKIISGGQYASFVYGPNRQRIKQINSIGTSNPDRQIHYVGRYFEWEKAVNGSIKKHRYRSTVFAYGKAVFWRKDSINDDGCSANPGTETYFPLRDHLGSVDVLASYIGASDQQYSYDAFGKRRNQPGWTADTADNLLSQDHVIKRGYTGHEHLDNVKLIHMNGRVQDPIIDRMLSPDPVLGDLRDPQSLNSYSYVNNNPASLADPSGFCTVVTATDSRFGDLETRYSSDCFSSIGAVTNVSRGVGGASAGLLLDRKLDAFLESFEHLRDRYLNQVYGLCEGYCDHLKDGQSMEEIVVTTEGPSQENSGQENSGREFQDVDTGGDGWRVGGYVSGQGDIVPGYGWGITEVGWVGGRDGVGDDSSVQNSIGFDIDVEVEAGIFFGSRPPQLDESYWGVEIDIGSFHVTFGGSEQNPFHLGVGAGANPLPGGEISLPGTGYDPNPAPNPTLY